MPSFTTRVAERCMPCARLTTSSLWRTWIIIHCKRVRFGLRIVICSRGMYASYFSANTRHSRVVMMKVLNRKGSSFESDVYSFGMVIWECLTRKIPWTKIPGVDMLLLAVTGGERPDIPDHASPVLASLMTSCWAQAAATRPTFRGILVELASHHVDGGKQYGRGDARTKQSASCQRSSVIAAATEMEDLEKGTFSQEWRQWSHSTMTLSAPSAPTMASSVGSTSRADERKRGEELRRSPPPSYWDH